MAHELEIRNGEASMMYVGDVPRHGLGTGRYEEVAILHSEGEVSWTDEADMYESMKKKAAELGANAIILDAMSKPSAGAKVAGAFLGTGAERKGKAIAIYVYPGLRTNTEEADAGIN
ncbi:MAG: hypothetical protein ACREMD_01270 [Gemmatimonadota bacterium]